MRGYNEMKRAVLAVLRDHGWQRPKELASIFGYRVASMHSYLARLRKWGLVWRRDLPFTEYRISQRGRDRLRWLEANRAVNRAVQKGGNYYA
jgi:DNA-binding IclR family transcriptional regulator